MAVIMHCVLYNCVVLYMFLPSNRRASVGTVKMIFNPESGYRLNDMQ